MKYVIFASLLLIVFSSVNANAHRKWTKVGTSTDRSETLYADTNAVNCYRSGVCTYWFLMKFSKIQNDSSVDKDLVVASDSSHQYPDYDESLSLTPIDCKNYSMGPDVEDIDRLHGKVVDHYSHELEVDPSRYVFMGDLVSSPDMQYAQIAAVCGSYEVSG